MLVHLGGNGGFHMQHSSSVLRRGRLSFERLFLRGTFSLHQAGRVLMSGGGVGLVVFLVVLGGQTWPLLFGLSVPVFRSSSRVSNSGRGYDALRSRVREQGLPSASETDRGPLPFGVCAG
jgi:hypothetical protein